jgi:hypothetical protein
MHAQTIESRRLDSGLFRCRDCACCLWDIREEFRREDRRSVYCNSCSFSDINNDVKIDDTNANDVGNRCSAPSDGLDQMPAV